MTNSLAGFNISSELATLAKGSRYRDRMIFDSNIDSSAGQLRLNG
jgi:hypothetical protein